MRLARFAAARPPQSGRRSVLALGVSVRLPGAKRRTITC